MLKPGPGARRSRVSSLILFGIVALRAVTSCHNDGKSASASAASIFLRTCKPPRAITTSTWGSTVARHGERQSLFFTAIAGRQREVVGTRQDAFQWGDTADTWGRKVTIAEISATGRGREWSTDRALGAWRTFSEMDHEDDEAVAGFIQRHGDIDSALTASTPIRTRYWPTLKAHLREIGRAWDPADGRTRQSGRLSDDAELVQSAKAHVKRIEKPFMENGAERLFRRRCRLCDRISHARRPPARQRDRHAAQRRADAYLRQLPRLVTK